MRKIFFSEYSSNTNQYPWICCIIEQVIFIVVVNVKPHGIPKTTPIAMPVRMSKSILIVEW